MMQQHTIHIAGGVVRNPLVRLTEPVTLDFLAGEHIAIVGPNGAGKSLLVDMLTGKYPLRDGELTYDFSPSLTKTAYDNIKYIAFRDTYGSADANYYYQQRWNAHDQEDAPLVREVLGEVKDDALRRQLFELFSIEPMLDKKIILLSSGELRKFQLTKALLTVPRILIMDNPFIGLDAPTRELLFNLLDRLTRLGELQIVLVLSMLDDIPSFVTHVVPVEEMKVGEKMEREEYVQAFCAGNQMRIQEEAGALEELQRRILDLPYEHANFTSDEVVKLNGVSIRYDDRTILKELDWTVMRGEKWALSGENGAGKSTLLSLVCADNPQSYACDISLFGRKRGTGESIWEIKKHIGYVSPEMHRAYLKNLPAIEIVASGLHDSIGLYKRPHAEQMSVCEWWMDIFGIAALKDKPFLQLSSGEQRLALLARAFVKDPELLILDEPLHGLDTYNRRRVKKIIEAFCHRRDKTMIMVTHYENELPQTITNRLFLKRNRGPNNIASGKDNKGLAGTIYDVNRYICNINHLNIYIMKFFIDTANLEQIREAYDLGVLDGVTTNPSLMAKEGIKGVENQRKHYVDICNIVQGDVSAEVIATDYEGMIKEGEELAALNPHIVVKVPCIAEGIKAVKYFSGKGIRTNCTLVFSVGQALLAAKAGATYVSPFVGRLDDICEDGIALVAKIVEMYRYYGYTTQVLAASIRHTAHIMQCIEVGADVATCPLSAIKGLLNHPLTDSGLRKFLEDYKRVNG